MALKAAKKQLAVPGATCPAMKKNGRLPTAFEQRLYQAGSTLVPKRVCARRLQGSRCWQVGSSCAASWRSGSTRMKAFA